MPPKKRGRASAGGSASAPASASQPAEEPAEEPTSSQSQPTASQPDSQPESQPADETTTSTPKRATPKRGAKASAAAAAQAAAAAAAQAAAAAAAAAREEEAAAKEARDAAMDVDAAKSAAEIAPVRNARGSANLRRPHAACSQDERAGANWEIAQVEAAVKKARVEEESAPAAPAPAAAVAPAPAPVPAPVPAAVAAVPAAPQNAADRRRGLFNPTLHEIESDPLTALAHEHWPVAPATTAKGKGAARPRAFDPALVVRILDQELRPSGFSFSRIMLLEFSQYLERCVRLPRRAPIPLGAHDSRMPPDPRLPFFPSASTPLPLFPLHPTRALFCTLLAGRADTCGPTLTPARRRCSTSSRSCSW